MSGSTNVFPSTDLINVSASSVARGFKLAGRIARSGFGELGPGPRPLELLAAGLGNSVRFSVRVLKTKGELASFVHFLLLDRLKAPGLERAPGSRIAGACKGMPDRWLGSARPAHCGRGRDEHRCSRPAQIRTCGTTAYGSCLGCMASGERSEKSAQSCLSRSAAWRTRLNPLHTVARR
jgi:hypothetical protein